jgi:arylsulfatase
VLRGYIPHFATIGPWANIAFGESLRLGALALLALICIGSEGRAQERKPNIVLMLMDNLGYGELGVYGGGILRGAATPKIDQLAGEGMRLLNFNVEAQCTPSRSALMTGRFAMRSGTYEVPIGGMPDGFPLWEITIAQLLSQQGYATGIWGKWHLGSATPRLPTNRGFDEWYGIPRTYNEAQWPSLNETRGMWPSVGNTQGWNARIVAPQPIYDAHQGEMPRQIGTLDVENRRTTEAEITKRAVEFIKRNASVNKPFFAYVSFSLMHMPTLPNPEFIGRTGNGDWADCLAEMDYRTGQILEAIRQADIEDNTLVIFTSDNGPEATNPWQGDSGPWRGTYFTAMEASLRTPFIIRWPGKVPAGVSGGVNPHFFGGRRTKCGTGDARPQIVRTSSAYASGELEGAGNGAFRRGQGGRLSRESPRFMRPLAVWRYPERRADWRRKAEARQPQWWQ